MIVRRTLTLSKPLTAQTLSKIKVKPTPQQVANQLLQDKKNKQNRIRQALDWLCNRYPLCFNPKDPKPLKLKIAEDVLIDRDTVTNRLSIPSKKSLRDAIGFYVNDIKYLKSHIKYDQRINLQGEVIGNELVTRGQKDYTTKQLAHIALKYASIKQRKMGRNNRESNNKTGLRPKHNQKNQPASDHPDAGMTLKSGQSSTS